MYLQLADNNEEMVAYQPIKTSHGTVYVRPDFPMLSANGKAKVAVRKAAAKVLPKIATAYSAAGLPYSAQVSKGANIVAAKTASGQPLLPSKVSSKIKKVAGQIGKNIKDKRAAKKAAGAPAASAPESPEILQLTTKNKFMQFIDQYKKPLLIGGSALAIGGITYGIIKSKRKKK